MQKQNQGSLTIAEFTKRFGDKSPIIIHEGLIVRWVREGLVTEDVYNDLVAGYVVLIEGWYAYLSQKLSTTFTPLSKIVA